MPHNNPPHMIPSSCFSSSSNSSSTSSNPAATSHQNHSHNHHEARQRSRAPSLSLSASTDDHCDTFDCESHDVSRRHQQTGCGQSDSQDEEDGDGERDDLLDPQSRLELRKRRNTAAARRSRKRKLEKMTSLSETIRSLSDQNTTLTVKLAVMESERAVKLNRQLALLDRVQALEMQLEESHRALIAMRN